MRCTFFFHVSQICQVGAAGISHNKLLAKVASAMNKPDGQTVILHRAVPALMAGLPLRKIRNFGGKVGELLEGLGCSTAQDVQQLGARTLVAKCGDPKQAEYVPVHVIQLLPKHGHISCSFS
jgi:DNA polymerase eta